MNANYNNNLLLQQQQQHLQQQQHQNPQQGGQQQQQQRQPSLQQDQSMNQSNMDPTRVPQWAQLQYGQNAAADMNHAKSAQFAEMMKRNQVANQFSRHQPPQSFVGAAAIGLGIQQPQNGANILAGNLQQQSFQEHPSNTSQQNHVSQPFNMGVMSNGNTNAAASASLQGRNPSGGLPGSQTARPLDMMGMVQGQQLNGNKFPPPQQSQLTSLRDSQQMQFPQAINQSSSDMFPEGVRRPSPHPGNVMQGPGLPHPGFLGASHPQTPFELQQRIQSLRNSIKILETHHGVARMQASNSRGNPTIEAQCNQKSVAIETEIMRRQEILNRYIVMWQKLQSRSASQQSSIAAGNVGQSSNNQWTPHPNPAQSFDLSGQTRPQSMSLLPNQPMQTSPNLPQASAQANSLLNSGLLPPRTIPTPQQQPQSIAPHAATHNGMGTGSFTKPNPLIPTQSSIGSVQGGNSVPNFTSPISLPGMDKSQFDANFKIFLSKWSGNIDPRLAFPENRPVDLHGLHLQVMQEGGFSKIEGNDNLWSIIAARLGYVQFPGTLTEPAKSGPGVAQSIQHLYKKYIAPFEAWYMAMLQAFKRHPNAAFQNALSNSRYSPQQLLQMANMSLAELQNLGVDEKTIQFLETHKASLQRMLQDHRAFAENVRNNVSQNAGPGDQNGAIHRIGSSPPFGTGSPQQAQQQNLISMASRQQLHHQLMQQQGGQHLQSTIPNGGVPLMGLRMPGQQMAAQGHMGVQKQAAQLLEQFRRNEYLRTKYPNANLDVPMEQQVEYTQLLERLHQECVKVENCLGTMVIFLKDVDENLLKTVMTILCAVDEQQNNLSSASGPRYIVALDELKAMAGELSRINDIFVASLQNFKMQKSQQVLRQPQAQMSAHPVAKQEMPSQPARATIPHNRPPSELPQQQPHQPQPPLNPNQGVRLPAATSLHPPKRKPTQTPGSSGPASSPSPIPGASTPTPVANTPTPTATASSPPAAAKSPKAKASKSKAKQRRSSKVVQSVSAVPAVEEMKPAPVTSVASGKRQREENSTTNSGGNGNNPGESTEVVDEGSPPKRVKSEWESQPSEAHRKTSEVVANIKTEDEPAFFDQITELIKKAAEEEGGQPSSITTGISETLGMLLKGYGPAINGLSGTSMGVESSSSRDPDAVPALGDPFDEFFDFSFGTVEDEDIKTPDLVSSSSTNPSPESNDDAESGHHLLTSTSSSTIDIKTEDLSDPLRLGTWKEIDGGEAAYYQTTEWKYDSPMTSFDQPWAIFNS